MNKLVQFCILVTALTIIGFGFIAPKIPSDFNILDFGKLPVQYGGRIQPIDSVARDTLLQLRGKQTIRVAGEGILHPVPWFADLTMRPELVHSYPAFRIDNAEVLALFNKKQSDGKYFSFTELQPYLEEVAQQHASIPESLQDQTAYDQQLEKLYTGLTRYHELLYTLHPMGMLDNLELEYKGWTNLIGPGMEAIRSQQRGQPFDSDAIGSFATLADHYLEVSKITPVGIVPDLDTEAWKNIGQSLLDTIPQGGLDPITLDYGRLISAYRRGDADAFNALLDELLTLLEAAVPMKKIRFEVLFNQFAPFYRSTLLYGFVFLLILASWVTRLRIFGYGAQKVLFIAFIIHTLGLAARIYIQGRPPVTNLYSSAIFVGWGAVLFGMILERIHKNGLGAAVASLVGMSTLIIAHQLSLSGDTLQEVRAVLDSNFWLATHVIVITLGYAAMFLAGGISMLALIKSLITRKLPTKSTHSMLYGIICFAALFSFVGTMLGGIWADQSWGRFWGWDPKENGALLIVLWCAVMLHARWGKLVSLRGFQLMAILGNIITAWSWFGTNMLSVGLHSYGFIDKAFAALMLFIFSQLFLVALGLTLSPKAPPRG